MDTGLAEEIMDLRPTNTFLPMVIEGACGVLSQAFNHALSPIQVPAPMVMEPARMACTPAPKETPGKHCCKKGSGGGAGLIHFTHEQILFAVCAVQWFARWLAHPALSRGNLGEIAYESRDKFQDR